MHQTSENQPEKLEPSKRVPLSYTLIVTGLIGTAVMVLYARALSAPMLFDEQYLTNWLTSVGAEGIDALVERGLLFYLGPQIGDSFGQLAAPILLMVTPVMAGSALAGRLLGVLLHIVNCFMVYLLTERVLFRKPPLLLGDRIAWLPASATMLFAMHPLLSEAVLWLPGIVYQLGTLFVVCSFFLFFKGKEEKNWTIVGVASILFALAILIDRSTWAASFSLVAFWLGTTLLGIGKKIPIFASDTIEEVEEIEDAVDRMLAEESGEAGPAEESSDVSPASQERQEKLEENQTAAQEATKQPEPQNEELFESLLPILPFILLSAVIPMAGLAGASNELVSKDIVVTGSDWANVAKALFLPIDETVSSSYRGQCTFLYVFFGFCAAPILLALWKNKYFRHPLIFFTIWLVVAVVPHMHQTLEPHSLYGSRWLYHASVPLCGLTSLMLCSFAYFIDGIAAASSFKWRCGSTIFAGTLCLSLVIFFASLTARQVRSFSHSAGLVKKVQASARNISAKEKSDIVLIRDVGRNTSVVPIVSPYRIVALDGETGLVRAPSIVGGKLKDSLRAGRLRSITTHWVDELGALIPLDLSTHDADYGRDAGHLTTSMKANGIVVRLIPPLKYWKTGTYDSVADSWDFMSNSSDRPTFNMDGSGLSPIGPRDFIYVEAKIVTPTVDPDAYVQVQWLTNWQKKYAWDGRMVRARATVNDDKFHRYFFPLRSVAWCTNGPLEQLSVSFPGGANVSVREIGSAPSEGRLPALTVVGKRETGNSQSGSRIYAANFINYPNDADLGLHTLSGEDSGIKLAYDASTIDGCLKCSLEISKANSFFEFPNDYKFSRDPLKRMDLDGASGEIVLPTDSFAKPAVYSLRLFALDNGGRVVERSSDSINLLVDR